MQHTRVPIALAAALVALAATAGDKAIDIRSDLEGKYYLVETGGTAEKPTLVVKRIAPGISHFVKREFDCEANSVRYLGEGETADEMNEAEPDIEAQPILKGSIADQLKRFVCPKEKD